ncbi:aldo/keto reductase [Mesorhizobium sp. BR1-1-16]|uniref:aldo/keto reductase n=1 Tax=Mesorhizobium sp. BR1-1-16 TaxID=2876653 RepID=UPI001CCAF28D|nr:aldo/keto reductase [Mesorhizobium sp. BR1-1-16]MBZ9936979.1 aldo/keto reductase [Mesorhizobium sp. BR1-1-16]
MASSVPTLELAEGVLMPQLGLGVWQVKDDAVEEPVLSAISTGYRLIDTAEGYGNEAGVGRTIQASDVPRAEIFLTTKLDNSRQGYDEALRAFDESLGKLQTDYLDLFLIHWPLPMQDNYVATWNAFIRLRDEGRVRAIGVSNFLPEHIERLKNETGVMPSVNQIELHPEFQQRRVRDFHRTHGIKIEAYSPLGSGAVLDNPDIALLAQRLEKSPAQIILRWHIQQGIIAIPKSATPDRIRSNFEIFDFELTSDEMALIASLDKGEEGRTGSDPATFGQRD